MQLTEKVLIIAEAGVNHNGSLSIAKQLIAAAAAAGADCIKFQTFKAEKLVSAKAALADYQAKNTGTADDSQFAMLKKLEMPDEWYPELKQYAARHNIVFVSTGFDEDSIDFLEDLGVPFFKIPSGEITNRPFLEHIAAKGKPVILSTGMSEMNEIKAAIQVMIDKGLAKDKVTVLHCNTEYPTPMTDVNLRAMKTIGFELGVNVGYSDHTLGIEVPIAAVALGATVIEKHITLDRNMSGPDHLSSLEPHELKEMVKALRNISLAISGDGQKKISESESKNKVIARKSIHLKKQLTAGHRLSPADLEMKRPGDGISPMEINKVLGRKIKKDLPFEYKLTLNDLE